MQFEWDEEKKRRNLAKHKLSFEIGAEVFLDFGAITLEEQFIRGERRLVTLGSVPEGDVLVVVYTLKGEENDDETIRIISVRKATRRERQIYEQSRKR